VPRTVVVIPTYNEAENLPVLVERLGVEAPDVDILCVDDASPDGTGFVADRIAAESSRFHVLHRAGARGYARASRDGLSWALDRGYDLVCTMDADLSHDPATLPALLAASDPGADLVIGSRYVPGGEIVVDWGPVRWAVSRMGSAYARTMIGCPVNDCTSGFRCYRAANGTSASAGPGSSRSRSDTSTGAPARRRSRARSSSRPSSSRRGSGRAACSD
jgi:dolichol-phosphate mannosyltransferase